MKINSQKAVSAATILLCFAFGPAFGFALMHEDTASSTVLPSAAKATHIAPMPVDVPPPALDLPIQASPVVVAVARPRHTMTAQRAKVWVCGAPHGLASDAVATVRDCEWK